MIPPSTLDAMVAAARLESQRMAEITGRPSCVTPFGARQLSTVLLEAALAEGGVQLARCSCPVGWGSVRDANCPEHGQGAAHTVSGAEVRETRQVTRRVPRGGTFSLAYPVIEYEPSDPLICMVCGAPHAKHRGTELLCPTEGVRP